jgi:hypothetical protein
MAAPTTYIESDRPLGVTRSLARTPAHDQAAAGFSGAPARSPAKKAEGQQESRDHGLLLLLFSSVLTLYGGIAFGLYELVEAIA